MDWVMQSIWKRTAAASGAIGATFTVAALPAVLGRPEASIWVIAGLVLVVALLALLAFRILSRGLIVEKVQASSHSSTKLTWRISLRHPRRRPKVKRGQSSKQGRDSKAADDGHDKLPGDGHEAARWRT